MNINQTIRLGTRGSLLALIQAQMVEDSLQTILPTVTIEKKIIKTTGEAIKEEPLAAFGGKALFIKELEEELLKETIDVAVHSMKDVEMPLNPAFALACFLERDDPRDALVSRHHETLYNLPLNAKIGTCSPRRKAQLLALRPDLKIFSLRGNIDKRLEKVFAGEYDAIVIAYAGLKRIMRTDVIAQVFEPYEMIPAVAQGVITLEILQKNASLNNIVKGFSHFKTGQIVNIETQFLLGFGGNCSTPIAGWARFETEEILRLDAQVLTPKGDRTFQKSLQGPYESLIKEAYELGQEFKAWYIQNEI